MSASRERARNRPLPRFLKVTSGVIATAMFSLCVAACGSPSQGGVAQLGATTTTVAGASPSSSSGPEQLHQALAYAVCMRRHGLSKYPDPNSEGELPKVGPQQLGVSDSQFQTIQKSCVRLLPKSSQSSKAWDQMLMHSLFQFARCVRAHGVPSWPDPLAESDPGQPDTPGFPRTLPGIDTNDPQVEHAMNACQRLIPGYSSGGYP